MKVDPFIEAEKSQVTTSPKACGLLEVSKSAYYERRNGAPSARQLSDAELTEQITRHPHRIQGHLWRPADPQGAPATVTWPAGKRKVTRLMRQAGLEGRCKKRWRTTTVADPAAEAARDLIQRHFGPCEEIDRRYVGDITYISTWEGWAYLATVIDLATRKVVGWALADHMRTELVEDALTMAFANRPPQRASSFIPTAAVNTRAGLRRAGPGQRRRALGRTKGECWDNAVAESFFATIKRELIDTRLAHQGRTSPGGLRVHRGLVQHPPAAFVARLPQPRPIRSVHNNADRQAA